MALPSTTHLCKVATHAAVDAARRLCRLLPVEGVYEYMRAEAHPAVPNDYVAAVVTKDDTHPLHAHAQVSRCAADDRIQPDGVSVDIKSASTENKKNTHSGKLVPLCSLFTVLSCARTQCALCGRTLPARADAECSFRRAILP